MKLGSNFENGQQWAWDSTSIGLIQTCPRKYYYKIVCGWEPNVRSIHLEFGGLYATALEHYYLHTFNGVDPDEALIKVVREVLENTWDNETDEPVVWPARNEQTNTKSRETLVRTIVWYLTEFADDPTTPVCLTDGKPAVEHSFKINVGNDIFYCGHLDRAVEYSGDVYVMDQKTTGSTITPYYFKQFDTSFQMSGYSFAGKMILGTPVKGVIIDAAQIAKGFSRFSRSITLRNEAQLDEWLNDLHYWVEYANKCNSENNYPMNHSSCGNYGGCEFANVCSKPAKLRDNFLRGDFKQKTPWNPLIER